MDLLDTILPIADKLARENLYPVFDADLTMAVKTVGWYIRAMGDAVRDFYHEKIDVGGFIDKMIYIIGNQLRRAWNEGMRANGLDPAVDMTPEWEEALQWAIKREEDYVLQLASDIEKARLAGAGAHVFNRRINLWANRYRDIVNLARIETSKSNVKWKWVFGDTKHCDTCAALDGLVASKKIWERSGFRPQHPPNTHLDCEGWQCKCEFVETKERQDYGAATKLEKIYADHVAGLLKAGFRIDQLRGRDGKWVDEPGGSSVAVMERPTVGKENVYMGDGLWKINSGGLPKDTQRFIVGIKGEHRGEVYVSVIKGEYHNEMMWSIEGGYGNWDNWVRGYVGADPEYLQDEAISIYTDAAGIVIRDTESELKAIDNIYYALDRLSAVGVPDSHKVRITKVMTYTVIQTSIKAGFRPDQLRGRDGRWVPEFRDKGGFEQTNIDDVYAERVNKPIIKSKTWSFPYRNGVFDSVNTNRVVVDYEGNFYGFSESELHTQIYAALTLDNQSQFSERERGDAFNALVDAIEEDINVESIAQDRLGLFSGEVVHNYIMSYSFKDEAIGASNLQEKQDIINKMLRAIQRAVKNDNLIMYDSSSMERIYPGSIHLNVAGYNISIPYNEFENVRNITIFNPEEFRGSSATYHLKAGFRPSQTRGADGRWVYEGRDKQVYYHGRTGESPNVLGRDGNIWLSTAKVTAEQFANIEDVYYPYRDEGERHVRIQHGEIWQVRAKFKNPKVVSIDETMWKVEEESRVIEQAKGEGYDAVIIKHPLKRDVVVWDENLIEVIEVSRGSTKAGFRPDQLRGSDGKWVDEGRHRVYNRTQDVDGELEKKKLKRAKELLEVMRKNPEGFSYQIELEITPTKGYMVAPSKDTEKNIPVGEGELEDVIEFVDKHWDALQQPGNYAGGWLNKKKNVYVLDVSINAMDRDEAIKIGILGRQDSVWDVVNYEEILMEDYYLKGGKVYARKK